VNHGTIWDKQELKQIVQLFEEGESKEEVAKELKQSTIEVGLKLNCVILHHRSVTVFL
jgi:hypothetical protein